MENERPVVPTGCFFQGCYNPEYEAEIRKGKDLCVRFNTLHPCDREGQTAVLKELLGEMGRDVVFTPPFWCDYGYNIKVGDSFYANHNLVITDGAGSVVTRDIPPRTVAVGVPCRVVREITEADRHRYPMHESIKDKFRP